MDLTAFWRAHPAAALAFSGGADSAYLLHSALEAGACVTAYFVKTEFQPRFALDGARRLAAELGARLAVLERSSLALPAVAANPPDRCYHCKRELFTAIGERARADGYEWVLDGSNASDDPDDRPGMRALEELGVLSPLRLCGLTKEDVRRLSRAAGLSTWNLPAYACLATRFPAGMAITAPELAAVEAAETQLFSLGFTDFRVRRTAGGALLQLPEAQLGAALARREEILAALPPSLGTVALDLRPRGRGEAPEDDCLRDRVTELQCNLDDMTGEDLAFAVELLLERGALDVWTTPITMKKGRPAALLSCLCRPEDAERFTALLLKHTTTLGVRRSGFERTCMRRAVRQCGDIRVKTAEGCGVRKEKPEFDDLAALARREDVSMQALRRRFGG